MGNMAMARMTKIDAKVLSVPPMATATPPHGISAGIAVLPAGPVLALTLVPVDGTAVVALLDVDTFASLADLLTLVGGELTERFGPPSTRQ